MSLFSKVRRAVRGEVVSLTAEGYLCDAEEEAREKLNAWFDDGHWPKGAPGGVGLINLERMTIGVDTSDGRCFAYWYVRRDYGCGGKLPTRADALLLIHDELNGCSCKVVTDLLCTVHGDARDTSVDVSRETLVWA